MRRWIELLDSRGELRRIPVEVDPYLEITEIADRLIKRNGPALLFEKVKGHSAPVLINAFGSNKRMATALGVSDVEDIADRIRKLVKPELPEGWVAKLRALGDLRELAAANPRLVGRAANQDVVEANPSLHSLPVITCWPEDGGPYITLGLTISKDPRDGKRNVGLYRLQVFGPTEAGMHWQLHKGGAEHERLAAGQRMPIAIAIGADPAVTYAASAPLPPGIDELMFAGFITGSPVELVRAKTVDLEVPASAEYILEGYVDPAERRLEGPFGDHTGFYSLADQYPVFHLTALTHRRNPVYQTTIVGRPPMEDYWLGKTTERLFLPLIQLIVPEILDMNMPAEGVFHNLVVVKIRKRFPGHAQKTMYALWGLGQMMFARNIVVLDEDANVHDLSEVAWRVAGNVDAGRDLVLSQGPVDVLDHAAPLPALGTRLGIDATRKSAGDGYMREWPNDIVMSPEVRERVTRRWLDYGLGDFTP
ncbi:MAG: menaquinone biosynthesis decarboxylase [Chloroflexi bacterium]|nr:menaquinone biosynthesis decarboxylase [Chloroflexota bacterium]